MRSDNLQQHLQSILNLSIVRTWQTLRGRLAPFSPAPSNSVTIRVVHLDANLDRLAADLDAQYQRQMLQGIKCYREY